MVLRMDLGSGQETKLLAAGHLVNDSQRHTVTVTRTGLNITVVVDTLELQQTLNVDTHLTLEVESSEI